VRLNPFQFAVARRYAQLVKLAEERPLAILEAAELARLQKTVLRYEAEEIADVPVEAAW